MNVGPVDALIRLLVGWILIHLGPVFRVKTGKVVRWILIIIGVILVLTAVTRYCGLYSLLKINTL
ncbi:MAG: YgaP family membrane protein [Candidatus Saccharicenans sp.]